MPGVMLPFGYILFHFCVDSILAILKFSAVYDKERVVLLCDGLPLPAG